MKRLKTAIFFTAGIGDSLILVPLAKRLRGFSDVDGIFINPYQELFWGSEILQKKVLVHNWWHILQLVFFRNRYDSVFLDFFSVNRTNILISWWISRKVYAQQNNNVKLPFFIHQKIHWIEPEIGIHMSSVNCSLANQKQVSIFDFLLPEPPKAFFDVPENYMVIQLSGGNNKTPYKIWPIEHWVQTIEQLLHQTSYSIVLLGDHHEIELEKNLPTSSKILSLIGKTNLEQAAYILKKSVLFVGHDSGLMHLAVAMNTPTITIWGASDPILFAYHPFDSKHVIIHHALACAPCNAWINPNTIRVQNPLDCPDFKCIRAITVTEVVEKIRSTLDV